MCHIQHFLLCLSVFIGLTLTTPVKRLLADRKYCGYQHTDDYTRPNSNISIDEFPWMAQLVYDESQKILCSGSLINNRYVLTVAHCLNPLHNNLTMVRLGDYNLKTEEDCISHDEYGTECSDPVQQYHIAEKLEHPSFHKRTGENDVGLIRLAEDVIFSDYIRPICLPRRNAPELTVGEYLTTSGWGTLGLGLEQTDLKKRVMAVLVSKEECMKMYMNLRKPITDDHLCAIETDSVTCTGDSGAPLMYSVKNQWEQVGIVSFGSGCGNVIPTVYSKVVNYLDWIEENLHQ